MPVKDPLTQPLQRHGPQLLHTQISDRIERMIASGQLPSRHRLPAETELSESLGVNHRTVRRAMMSLVEKGLIHRTPRAGTFVADTVQTSRQSIGLFYPAPNQERMLSRANKIQELLADKNCDVKIFGYQEDFFSDKNLLTQIEHSELSAALIVPLGTIACREQLARLEQHGFPYVRFSNLRHGNLLKAPGVSGDNLQSLTLAIETLIARGHRRIGFLGRLGWPFNAGTFQTLLADYGLECKDRWLYELPVATWDHQPARGQEVVSSIHTYMAENKDLTAVVVEQPHTVMTIINYAQQHGITIPEQLSVLSLIDWEPYAAMYPAVTAMHISEHEMVCTAIELLEEVINTPAEQRYQRPGSQKCIPFTLVREDNGSVAELVRRT